MQSRYSASSPLGTSHTKTIPTRFNGGVRASPQFEILYLAENHQVALFEVQALLGSPWSGVVPNPRSAWTILNMKVSLSRIVDLTDAGEQAILDTSAQELTGDWRGYQSRGMSSSVPLPTGLAPTQELGGTLFSAGDVEGFITLSARLPDQMILAVFPQRMGPRSIEYWDPLTGNVVYIP
jgi:hypothetical protein